MSMQKKVRLKRTLNLLDAVSICIGATIGAGIFVAVGLAAGLAGPALVFSVLIAALISSFTALSFAELSSAIPKEGGAYEYIFEIVSPQLGFLTGWMVIFGQIFVGAAVSLGLATYLALFIPLPLKLIAVLACLFFILLNLVGVKQSSEVNDALVVLKVIALCIFVVVGVFYIKTPNLSNLFPNGLSGVISGAALIFFAYIGYARVATVSEEVEDPKKTIPLSIIIGLVVSTVLYLLVSFTAVGVVNYNVLSASGTPLADAMKFTGNDLAVLVVSLGAIFATSSVLLTTILGVSRITFSMARNKQIPSFINSLHPKFQTPHISIMLTGLLMAVFALFWDLKQVFSLASFSVILTHVLVNYSAIKLRSHPKFKIPLRPLPPILGIVSCSALLLFLPAETWVMSGVILFLGIVFYLIKNRF